MPWSPRHNHLRFAVERGDERVTVLLAGELDCASAAVAHLALERAGPGAIEIVLDLSRVVFLDATGLRFLINAQRRARAAHRRLIVRRPSRSVRRMIELTGAWQLLSVEDADAGPFAGHADAALAGILDAAIEAAVRVARADMATAQLIDRSTGALRIVAQRGFNSPFLDYFELVTDGESVFGTAVRSGQPVWIPDVARSSILADTPALDVLLDTGVRALACVPAPAPEGQLLAMLSLHHRLVTDWTDEQKAGLEKLSRSVAQQSLTACASTPQFTPLVIRR
jgi:anti-anti-sigma factor